MNAKQDKKLRVGVIGLGMGRNHIDGYRLNTGCEVVALADPDPARLSEIGDAKSVMQRFSSGEELIDSGLCDVVSIATPNKFHKDLGIRALQKGSHVLCEKPMAMNATEAREMLAVAEQLGRRIMINFSYRFTPEAQALKARVDSGDLGNPYYGRSTWLRRRGMPGFGGWFGTRELAGGGPLIDLGVHRLDLALWFMGYPEAAWVDGATYDPIATELAAKEGRNYNVEDLAAGFIRFHNGASLVLEASWAGNIAENELMETRILGTKGGLVHRNIKDDYRFEAEFYVERDGQLWDEKFHPRTGWAAGAGKAPNTMDHFITCIREDKPHDATGEQGLAVMELLDALYESARNKAPVKLG